MASDPPKTKVLFKYKFPDLYSPVYCNGAWGGFTTQGELAVHFFLERVPLPNSETYAVDLGGNLGQLLERDPVISPMPMVLRSVATGVVMNVTTARAVIALLQAKIDEHDENLRARDKGKH